ncbi:MAG TPA: nicotinate-nucleotide adenylyltransferase [Desulfobacterales bacterium]|nr:nicotinate-nucleotide adenylyltransferase [Desulfobacterales bacterium]
MRIGLFGGTFNPIHIGHLRAALEVQEGFHLNRFYIIPAAIPPHKTLYGIANPRDRFEMVRLAVSNNPDFIVSDVELKRSGPSYTIDTVRFFESTLTKGTSLNLVLGLDAFLQMETWKSYMDLFLLIPFIVMARPGAAGSESKKKLKIIGNYLQSNISEGYKFNPSQNCFVHEKMKPVYVFDVSLLDISSTKIRNLIKQGRSIKFLVPEKVENYIKTKGLYL